MKATIKFHMLMPIKIGQRIRLKQYLNELFKKEKKELISLDYIFCSDDYLLTLNQTYLSHDTLTDIITFDLSNDKSSVSGEIYISSDRVKENARIFGVTINEEMLRVMFHGALHLCGYKDKNAIDKRLMTSKEDYYLKHFK